jgi:hypothetical protein
MDAWLAVQVEWVRDRLSDDDFIAAAAKIGRERDARERVAIYHTEFATPKPRTLKR